MGGELVLPKANCTHAVPPLDVRPSGPFQACVCTCHVSLNCRYIQLVSKSNVIHKKKKNRKEVTFPVLPVPSLRSHFGSISGSCLSARLASVWVRLEAVSNLITGNIVITVIQLYCSCASPEVNVWGAPGSTDGCYQMAATKWLHRSVFSPVVLPTF